VSFLAELKRRNVIRAGIAWLASSWVLVELTALLFPRLGLPRAAQQGLIVVLVLLLVPVVVFAWRYELTREGLRRDAGPGREGGENANTARRLDQVTVAMILVALGAGAWHRFVAPVSDPVAVTATAPSVARFKSRT
jgi:hypothetical protein